MQHDIFKDHSAGTEESALPRLWWHPWHPVDEDLAWPWLEIEPVKVTAKQVVVTLRGRAVTLDRDDLVRTGEVFCKKLREAVYTDAGREVAEARLAEQDRAHQERLKNPPPDKFVRFEVSAKLPHLVALAMVAEEAGRASGSTKLRGIGIPLPFTDHDGTATLIRLWAKWWKKDAGQVELRGFDVRLGKAHDGEQLSYILLKAEDDGTLRLRVGISRDSADLTKDTARLAELQRRLTDAEAQADLDDPLAVLARNAVALGGATFCCCCGRPLTHPVSVETGIGPECGAEFHRAFLAHWKAKRAT